jgi:hypothetical protein
MIPEIIEGDVEYKCDICEERFNSAADALNHSQKSHQLAGNDDPNRESSTGTPAEAEEEKRARNAINSHGK